MMLELQRDSQTAQGTTGRLFLDGAQFCVTLERPPSRFGEEHPCIPAGAYRVVLCESAHFGRVMPLLVDVPGRSGIEIHWGNYVNDFKGCIGVGASRSTLPDGSPAIWNTRLTFDRLFAAIESAQSEGCKILVRDPQPAIVREDSTSSETAEVA
jgi:hypothetical protein